ncbi:iron transporter [Pseudoalteromonas sp. McH1-42]|uniref:iron transporter n=1 Tax=Pseudoalteromonas sp. McH1-42 TaxID=2917752 RepID=UPI001EF57B51|nr:iron transporter [Pseudoalteromonas sp. McH1-42]MCG7561154.1 iron transporter [Pseudoalteromonas sp. McH1-42]
MLLNSVVITLNQCLPVAVVCVLLCATGKNVLSVKQGALGTLLGGLGCMALLILAADISVWWDYRGLELIQILILITLFVGLAGHYIFDLACARVMSLAAALTLYLSNFLTYFNGYWQMDEAFALMLGTVLGVSICASFAVLLYFSLLWATRKMLLLVTVFVALHSASKLVFASDLAAQIDIIPAYTALLDMRTWVDEYSVGGRILKVLFGYEATPSLWSILALAAGAGVFWFVYNWRQGSEA